MFKKLILFFFCAITLHAKDTILKINPTSPDIARLAPLITASIKELLAKRTQRRKPVPPVIVGIAGRSAVGRTTFTAALKKILEEQNIKTAILPQDDYIDTLHNDSVELSSSSLEYRVGVLHISLDEIKTGMNFSSRLKYSSIQQGFERIWFSLSDVSVLLFEGTYALTDHTSYGFGRYADLGIFLDADPEAIVTWNWQRETSGGGGRSRERFDKDVAWDMDDYEQHIRPTQKNAHFIITKTEKDNYFLTGSLV